MGETIAMEEIGSNNSKNDIRTERKFESSRKWAYFTGRVVPLICILEALIILSIFCYFFVLSPNKATDSLQSPTIDSQPTKDTLKAYSNGKSTIRVLESLVQNCDQRRHDFNHGVACNSFEASTCTKFSQPEPEDPNEPHLTIITTSKSGLRHSVKTQRPDYVKCDPSPIGACGFKTTLVIDPFDHGHTIVGWGGALTDSAINNILSLSINGTQSLIEDYFGDSGLRYNIARITIGGSDFSSRFYTNDDLEPGEPDDMKLDKFSLVDEDILYKIPLIKRIQDKFSTPEREIKLFASMWSPPTWMKTNNHFNQGQVKGSINGNSSEELPDEEYFKSLSQLKKKFLLAYMDQGVKFWGMTVMNEPLFAVQPFLNFNTMIFPSKDYANYVAKYLGPMLKTDPRLKHIKLMAHDDNKRYLESFLRYTMENNASRHYIDGVSVHGYTDEEYDIMDDFYRRYRIRDPDFFMLPTELCSGHLPFMEKALVGNWHRGVHYGLDIIHSLQHSASGWVDWNMALDTSGGPGWLGGRLDSAMIVDRALDTYYKSPMYYVLGHFSRYIPQGSLKLTSVSLNDMYDYHFESVTFLLPNKRDLVTVVLNNNPYDIELTIRVLDQGRQRLKSSLNGSGIDSDNGFEGGTSAGGANYDDDDDDYGRQSKHKQRQPNAQQLPTVVSDLTKNSGDKIHQIVVKAHSITTIINSNLISLG